MADRINANANANAIANGNSKKKRTRKKLASSPSPSPLPPPSWLSSLPLAPEFRPSLAEFADPIAYISKIEPHARSYGVCKIVPPFSSLPKHQVLATLDRSLLRRSDSPYSPQIGHASAAENVAGRMAMAMASVPPSPPPKFSPDLKARSVLPSSSSSSPPSSPSPSDSDGGDELKATFYTRRQQLGCSNGKRSSSATKGITHSSSSSSSLSKASSSSSSPASLSAQKLVWQSGESYTLEQFEAKANQFYRSRLKTDEDLSPLVIETLFWKEASSDKYITVEYGNDIHASAFEEPTMSSPPPYCKRKSGDYDRSSQELGVASPSSTTSHRKRKRLDLHHPLRASPRNPKLEPQKGQILIGANQEDPKDEPSRESCKAYRPKEEHFLQEEASILSEELQTSNQSETLPNHQSFCLNTTKEGANSSSGSQTSKDVPSLQEGSKPEADEASSNLAQTNWNMHFIARAPGSLLRYMPNEVPGVTSPMVYLGMLFSWFAWHVEDHELHSINYLHTGSPKTWYAVPGDAAQAFEEVVRVHGYGNISDPQVALALLSEKTTVMSPEVLVSAGVPCCRLVQNAGEFVVTFPRAYHQGFSHGFNCGEAANFASAGWLEVAKEAATRRASISYLPMLSHQQLLYLLALSFPPRITPSLSFEPTRSSQVVMEETIKIVFVDDIAYTNRLLGLLLDSGTTGCILLRDYVDLSWPPFEQTKHSYDHFELPTGLTVSCETTTTESSQQKSSITKIHKHQFPVNRRCPNVPSICKPPFRWGTFPCAACGVLCFPTMAVVNPASITVESPNPEKEVFDANPEKEVFDANPEKEVFDANPEKEVFDANPLVSSIVVETDDNHAVGFSSGSLLQSTSALPITSIILNDDNASFEDEMKKEILVCEKSPALINGMVSSIKQKRKTAEHGTILNASVSGLDCLAATYQDDSDADETKRKRVAGEAESGYSCIHPHSSLVSGAEGGATTGAPWTSLLDVHCTPVHDQNPAYASMAMRSNELDNFVCKDVPLLKGNTGSEMEEFMVQDISRVDYIDSAVTPEEIVQPLASCTSIAHENKVRNFRDADGSDRIDIFGQNRQPGSSAIENQDACMIDVKTVNYANPSCTGALSQVNNGNTVPENLKPIDVNYKHLSDDKEKSTVDMQTTRQSDGGKDGSHDFRKQILQSKETKTTNKIGGNLASRNGVVDGKSEILCDPLCSEIDVRPQCLCLQHALEACHKLKSLGGSQIVLVCHSEIEEMLQSAKLFAEELNLSHSWRPIPFRQASDIEGILLNMALNVEDGGMIHKNWVVGLGMSIHHNRNEFSLDQSGIWQHDSLSSLTKKEINDCNTSLTHTKNTHKRIRESYASGKVPKHQKLSVAGQWCGKIWMKSQVHPVLGGYHSTEAHSLSAKESASDCWPKFSETPKSVIDSVIEMNCTFGSPVGETNTQDTSPLERRSKKKSNRTTRNKFEPDLGPGSTCNWRKKREKEETGGSKDLSSSLCLVNQATRKTLCADVIDNTICCSAEISDIESEKIQMSENMLCDRDESDADIWQNIDVGCDTREAMSLDGISEVPDNSLILHSRQAIHAGVQENLLLPGIMRRRACSVFDSETHVQSPGQEGNRTPGHFVEYTTGEALHGLMRSEISEVVGYATLMEKKQNHLPSKKKLSKDVYGFSNLSAREVGSNTSAEVQDASLFGHSRDLCDTVVEADYVRSAGSGSMLAHPPVCQKIFTDSGSGENALDLVTENAISVKNNNLSQWKSSNDGHKSQSLIQCSNKRMAGKTRSKLRKRMKSEATESSDDEMIQKRTTHKRAQTKCDSGDQLFDYAGFFPEGPSTRLRTRSAVKVMKVDEDELLDMDESYTNAVPDNVRRDRKPQRRRGKKPTIDDAEEEFGEYCCDIEGCTMSFTSKQELNLHKRNACTFVGCGKRFGSHKYLLQHRRVHLDDRPLKCPWNGCQMTFKWKWACTEHYRVHTGERPYVCPVPECGQTFRFVSDFSRHKRKTGHGKQQSNSE